MNENKIKRYFFLMFWLLGFFFNLHPNLIIQLIGAGIICYISGYHISGYYLLKEQLK